MWADVSKTQTSPAHHNIQRTRINNLEFSSKKILSLTPLLKHSVGDGGPGREDDRRGARLTAGRLTQT